MPTYVTITAPTTGAPIANPVTVSGTYDLQETLNGQKVRCVYLDSLGNDTTTVQDFTILAAGQGNWSVTFGTLPDGSCGFRAFIIDNGGSQVGQAGSVGGLSLGTVTGGVGS